MMISTRLALVSALCAALFACSSTDTGGSSGTSGTPSSGTSGTSGTPTGGTSGTPTGGTSGTPTADAPTAPKLDQVAQMMNVLHVQWTNPATKCDSIEAERMATMADGAVMEKYKVAFSVAGDVDNKMDTSATENMKYTYRLRCKVGTQYSAYSNEASGTPKQ